MNMSNVKSPFAVFVQNIYLIIPICAYQAIPFNSFLHLENKAQLMQLMPFTLLGQYFGLCIMIRYYFSLNGETENNSFLKDGVKLIWVSIGAMLLIVLILFIPFLIFATLASAILGMGSWREILFSKSLPLVVFQNVYLLAVMNLSVFILPLIIAGKFDARSKYYIPKNWFTENFKLLFGNIKSLWPFIATMSAYTIISSILHYTLSLAPVFGAAEKFDVVKYLLRFLISIPFEIFMIYSIYLMLKYCENPFREKYPKDR